MNNEYEKNLIILAQKGDNASFKEILKINFKSSMSAIRKRFRLSSFDLDDVMQNTSLRVWRNLKNYHDIEHFSNWFFVIFRNEAIRFLSLKNKTELNEVTNIEINVDDDLFSNDNNSLKPLDFILADTARTFLERKERIHEYQQILDNLFQHLSSDHKEIIQLVLVDGNTYQEAADLLKIPKGSIMSRLFYARKESQKIINEYAKLNDLKSDVVGRFIKS
jgi:RNA polymerase sigma-70 factor (ECF subfamily)